MGVPRHLAWGFYFGGFCFVGVGSMMASLRVDASVAAALGWLVAVCYATFVGFRVHVRVRRLAAQSGYELCVSRLGRTSRSFAPGPPRLDAVTSVAFEGTRLESTQLQLTLRTGAGVLPLPALHAPEGSARALARLEAFEAAVSALDTTVQPAAGSRRKAKRKSARREQTQETWQFSRERPRSGWEFPRALLEDDRELEGLRWAKGQADPRTLRHGVTLPARRLLERMARFFASALVFVLLAAAIASERSLSLRLTAVAVLLVLISGLLGLASYAVTLRLTADGPAGITIERRIWGVLRWQQRLALGDGLRVLYTKRVSEDSVTVLSAYLAAPSGKLYALTNLGDPEDPARGLLDDFGASLADAEVVTAALELPDLGAPEWQPLERVPETASAAELVPAPKLVRFGLAVGSCWLVLGAGALAADVIHLRSAQRWHETTCEPDVVGRGRFQRRIYRPGIDRRVELRASGVLRPGAPCWVLDHPRGHDIALFEPPERAPSAWQKVHRSSLALFGLCLVLGGVSAGPWLRARRSRSVRTA